MEAAKVNNTKRPPRGRPAGSDRAPLSVDERRARNARYERERRMDHNSALADLSQALGVSVKDTQVNILIRAINRLKKDDKSADISIETLKRVNKKLKAQIRMLKEESTLTAMKLAGDSEVRDIRACLNGAPPDAKHFD